MDEPVPGRHAAIYAPARRLPKSFFLGAGVAALLHAGLAWYLINQTFAIPKAEPVGEGPIITIDTFKPEKPVVTPDKPKPIKTAPPIHDSPVTDKTQETIKVAPQPDGKQTLAPPEELPKVVVPPTTSEPGKGSVSVVRWTKFPDADALANYYPARAAEDEKEGSATVQCTVLDVSGRVSCVTVDESPPHYGFGSATVRMVQDKGRVDTSHGDIAVGSILRQTVAWHLN